MGDEAIRNIHNYSKLVSFAYVDPHNCCFGEMTREWKKPLKIDDSMNLSRSWQANKFMIRQSEIIADAANETKL